MQDARRMQMVHRGARLRPGPPQLVGRGGRTFFLGTADQGAKVRVAALQKQAELRFHLWGLNWPQKHIVVRKKLTKQIMGSKKDFENL